MAKQKVIIEIWPDVLALRAINALILEAGFWDVCPKEVSVHNHRGDYNGTEKSLSLAPYKRQNSTPKDKDFEEGEAEVSEFLYNKGVIFKKGSQIVLPSGAKVNPAFVPELLKRAEKAWRENLAFEKQDRGGQNVVVVENPVEIVRFALPLPPQTVESNSGGLFPEQPETWLVSQETAEKIKACAKFADKDEFGRHYCVRISPEKVFGTDAHILRAYYGSTGIPFELNIPREIAAKVKPGTLTKVNGEFRLNGLCWESPELSTLDIESVIPQENDAEFTIDCKELKRAVKQVLPFTNRTTKQIALNLNGTEYLTGLDMDFENESKVEFKVIARKGEAKQYFNGQLLLNCVSDFKGEVHMELHESCKAVLNRSESEVTLLMGVNPKMMEAYYSSEYKPTIAK